jgi:hypothetical protein
MDIDDKIRRGIKIAGWSILVLCLSPIVVVLVMRNLSPSAERQAAVALLQLPTPPVRGRDGSDAAWLLNYDVPLEKQAAAAAELRAYLRRHDLLLAASDYDAARALKDPRDSWPKYPGVDQKAPWLCAWDGIDCLASVRSDIAAAQAAATANARTFASMDRLLATDGTRWGLPPNIDQQAPNCACHQRLARSALALTFATGGQQKAIAGVCRSISGWRRLGSDTDTLSSASVSAGAVRRYLQLLSEMVGELPPDTPLPAECSVALAPTSDAELGICAASRTQFQAHAAMPARMQLAQKEAAGHFFISAFANTERLSAAIAPEFARYCEAPMLEMARADRSARSLVPQPTTCSLLQRIGDPGSCWFADLAVNDHFMAKYQDRRTDQAAALALMRTVLWVRGTKRGLTQTAFDTRPSGLGLRRQVLVAADGTNVSMPLLDTSGQERLVFRLRPAAGPKAAAVTE